MTPRHPAAVSPWRLATAFVLLAAGILAGGVLVYRQEREQLFAKQRAELNAIAALKVQQLAAWRRAREVDMGRIPANALTGDAIAQLAAGPGGARHTPALRTWLRAMRRADRLHAVYLTDAAGAVLLATEGAAPLSARARRAALDAMRTGRVVTTRIERDRPRASCTSTWPCRSRGPVEAPPPAQ